MEAHIPVMANEVIEAMSIKKNDMVIDCTFGRGGHSRQILAQLGSQGRLLAFDRDPAAIAEAATWQDPRFEIIHAPFSELSHQLAMRGLGAASVDAILLDLGVSSPQLDAADRGFSFKQDGPLDMRMDCSRGESAADWLARVEYAELARVLREQGEERFAARIASAILTHREKSPFTTTQQLAKVVATALPFHEPGKDPATRTFQAIRIHINQELDELSTVLPQAEAMLRPNGRLTVISFHSLEDRIVKRYLNSAANPPEPPRFIPLQSHQLPPARMHHVSRAIRPSSAEIMLNPRARSATLRTAQRSCSTDL